MKNFLIFQKTFPDNIYNADETGLFFYEALPDKTTAFKKKYVMQENRIKIE